MEEHDISELSVSAPSPKPLAIERLLGARISGDFGGTGSLHKDFIKGEDNIEKHLVASYQLPQDHWLLQERRPNSRSSDSLEFQERRTSVPFMPRPPLAYAHEEELDEEQRQALRIRARQKFRERGAAGRNVSPH